MENHEDDIQRNARLEMELDPSQSEEEVSRRIFREGLVPATQAIVHLANYGTNDNVRFRAATYVVERNLGPIASGLGKDEEWEALVKNIMRSEGADSDS